MVLGKHRCRHRHYNTIASFLDPWHLFALVELQNIAGHLLSFRTSPLIKATSFPGCFLLSPSSAFSRLEKKIKNLETRLTGVFTFLLVCSQTYSVQENNKSKES